MIPFKIPWTTLPPPGQARINWSNPITSSLKNFWLVNRQGAIDLVTGLNFPLTVGGSIVAGPHGLAFYNANDSEYIDLDQGYWSNAQAISVPTTELTLAVMASPYSYSDAWAGLLGRRGAGESAVALHLDADGDLRSMFNDGWGDTPDITPASTKPKTFVYGTSFVNNGSNAIDLIRWLGEDGKFTRADVTVGASENWHSTEEFRLGMDSYGATRTLHGLYYFAAQWWRGLKSTAELRSFALNPFQIFEPRTIWIPTAAGSTPIHFRRHVGFSYG